MITPIRLARRPHGSKCFTLIWRPWDINYQNNDHVVLDLIKIKVLYHISWYIYKEVSSVVMNY